MGCWAKVLDEAVAEEESLARDPKAAPNPLLLGRSPKAHVTGQECGMVLWWRCAANLADPRGEYVVEASRSRAAWGDKAKGPAESSRG